MLAVKALDSRVQFSLSLFGLLGLIQCSDYSSQLSTAGRVAQNPVSSYFQAADFSPTPSRVFGKQGMPYDFDYVIHYPAGSLNFGHREESDGFVVTGQYFVLLPDRRQIITYRADDSSRYRAKISYDEKAASPLQSFGHNGEFFQVQSTLASQHLSKSNHFRQDNHFGKQIYQQHYHNYQKTNQPIQEFDEIDQLQQLLPQQRIQQYQERSQDLQQQNLQNPLPQSSNSSNQNLPLPRQQHSGVQELQQSPQQYQQSVPLDNKLQEPQHSNADFQLSSLSQRTSEQPNKLSSQQYNAPKPSNKYQQAKQSASLPLLQIPSPLKSNSSKQVPNINQLYKEPKHSAFFLLPQMHQLTQGNQATFNLEAQSLQMLQFNQIQKKLRHIISQSMQRQQSGQDYQTPQQSSQSLQFQQASQTSIEERQSPSQSIQQQKLPKVEYSLSEKWQKSSLSPRNQNLLVQVGYPAISPPDPLGWGEPGIVARLNIL